MAKSPPEVIDGTGQTVRLGTVVGQGGEGAVWDIPARPDLVAKVYHQPLSVPRAQKIALMSNLASDELRKYTSWPASILRNKAGIAVGLLMPKISDRADIHNLYSPKSRRSQFMRADWRFLIHASVNTAIAFNAVHKAKVVIGDVNHGSILVGQNATVRLIDCDSFQIASAGQLFHCEVGVETFTPPELQGRSFRGITRTTNHDNFGLAVMVFLLLFMGRHPFAGRYSGTGEMTIARAIAEVRFPYGSNRSAVQMAPPPGTPPLSIVGARVEALFERAFSRPAIQSGRPTAREWAEALLALSKETRQCTMNSSHWHHRSTSCPWCPMEALTGISLFPPVARGDQNTGSFDLAAFWKHVNAVPDPGPAPQLNIGQTPSPSAQAIAAGRRSKMSLFAAWLVALAWGGVGFVTDYGFFYFVGFVSWFITRAVLKDTTSSEEIRNTHKDLTAKWEAAQKDWDAQAGNDAYRTIKRNLEELRRQFEGLPAERARLLEKLKSNVRQAQLERYLDQFEISKARIEGVGAGRTQILESFGIETALDITRTRVGAIDGFGPKTINKLIKWRDSVATKFVFNPNKGLDAVDLQKIDGEIRAKGKKIATQLDTFLAELRQASARIASARQFKQKYVEKIRDDLAQAQADLKAL
jgi:DNA-binding helix-hairpin-helix protein with protein kinase domain